MALSGPVESQGVFGIDCGCSRADCARSPQGRSRLAEQVVELCNGLLKRHSRFGYTSLYDTRMQEYSMIAKISNKTVLFTALTAAMMLSFPMMGIEATVQESLEEQEMAELHDTSRLDPTSEKFFDLIKRDELSDTEIEQAKNIMKSNDGLRQMIDNGLLEITSVSFVGNANTLPVKWYPVIHMADGMETTSVKLDLDTNEIMNMTTYKSHELHHSNAYAIDEYSGSLGLVKGITVTSENQPTNYKQ